jgi:hypothetical protein
VNQHQDKSAEDRRAEEFLGGGHVLWPSEVNHMGDPAAYTNRRDSWPLPERAALLVDVEPAAVAMFGADAMTQHLHAAHAEEAVGFNDRRATHGGEGRRAGPGRERHRED